MIAVLLGAPWDLVSVSAQAAVAMQVLEDQGDPHAPLEGPFIPPQGSTGAPAGSWHLNRNLSAATECRKASKWSLGQLLAAGSPMSMSAEPRTSTGLCWALPLFSTFPATFSSVLCLFLLSYESSLYIKVISSLSNTPDT